MEWSTLLEKGERPDYATFESEYRKRYGRPVSAFKDLRSNKKVVDEPLDMDMGFDQFEEEKNPRNLKIDALLEVERIRIKNMRNSEDNNS